MQSTPHAGLLQVVLELVALGVGLAVVAVLARDAHRSGLARLRAARDADEARILEGIRLARTQPYAFTVEPDGTQHVRIPAARPAPSPWED